MLFANLFTQVSATMPRIASKTPYIARGGCGVLVVKAVMAKLNTRFRGAIKVEKVPTSMYFRVMACPEIMSAPRHPENIVANQMLAGTAAKPKWS